MCAVVSLVNLQVKFLQMKSFSSKVNYTWWRQFAQQDHMYVKVAIARMYASTTALICCLVSDLSAELWPNHEVIVRVHCARGASIIYVTSFYAINHDMSLFF